MSSKYEPLRAWLKQQPEDRVRLTFREIEAILGFVLPDSARSLAQWWANAGGSHVQAIAWMGAGWRACQVDVPAEQVSFERAAARGGTHERQDGYAGVSENGAAFVADDPIIISRSALRGGALRLIEDYRDARGGSLADAAAGLLNGIALERRRQLLERFPLVGKPSSIDSADLIREERDAR
jgi:hypothetical protein